MRDAHHAGNVPTGYGADPGLSLTANERAAWFSSMAKRKNEGEALGTQIARVVLADTTARRDVRAKDLRNASTALAGTSDATVDPEIKRGFIRELTGSAGAKQPHLRLGANTDLPTPEAAAIVTVLRTMSAMDRATTLKQMPEGERDYYQKLFALQVEELWVCAAEPKLDEEIDVGH